LQRQREREREKAAYPKSLRTFSYIMKETCIKSALHQLAAILISEELNVINLNNIPNASSYVCNTSP
jgi:hypothetical protein